MRLEDYTALDGLALAAAVRSRSVTAEQLAACAAEASARVNPALNAVLEIYADRLDPAAPSTDAPFPGVPFLVKDLGAAEAGRRQEAGSQMLKGHVAEADCELVRRFRAAGFTLLGRSATPEFGWSASTESQLTGITRNP